MGLARRILGWIWFLIFTAFAVAKCVVDWVGRATFPEDVTNLWQGANPMIDWLARQPDLLFYGAALSLAMVGVGIICAPQIQCWVSKLKADTNPPQVNLAQATEVSTPPIIQTSTVFNYTQPPSAVYNITSNHQSGGITAQTVNLQTRPHRPLASTRGKLRQSFLLKNIPMDKEIEVAGLMGDAEGVLFANEIRTFLKDAGYRMVENGMAQVSMRTPPREFQ